MTADAGLASTPLVNRIFVPRRRMAGASHGGGDGRYRRRWRGAAALAALLAALPAGSGRQGAAEPAGAPAGFGAAASLLRGRAEVSDGDTLRIGAERIRIFGIDAPEAGQSCDSGAKGAWACGAAATARLRELIGDRPVTCLPRDRDRYGRLVATCRVGRLDLGERLVAEGLARAYTRFGDDYAATERRAKTEAIGLWHGPAAAPWEFRAARAAVRRRAAVAGMPDQGQRRDLGRPRLSPARRPLLRAHPHRPAARRGLVLRRGGGAGGRLPGRPQITTGV